MQFKTVSVNGVKKIPLDPKQQYEIPNADYVRVYAGKVSFFLSSDGVTSDIIITRVGKFFKIPNGRKNVSFPNYYYNGSGHNYNLPVFS